MLNKSLLTAMLIAAGSTLLLCGCQSAKPQWDKDSDYEAVPRASVDPGSSVEISNPSELPQPAGGSSWTSNPGELAAAGADKDGWTPVDSTGGRLGMPVIYFAYDSDVLVPSEMAKVERIANYMSDKPELGLLIEGHCDQRGTEEYNRALGERRANAIRAALESKGMAPNRIKTQSFGEDKPAVEGEGPNIWKQNRRGVPIPMMIPR